MRQRADLRNCFETSRWRKVHSGECIDQAAPQGLPRLSMLIHCSMPFFVPRARRVNVVLLSSHKISDPISTSIRDPFAGAVHRRLTRAAGVRRRWTQRRNSAAHVREPSPNRPQCLHYTRQVVHACVRSKAGRCEWVELEHDYMGLLVLRPVRGCERPRGWGETHLLVRGVSSC